MKILPVQHNYIRTSKNTQKPYQLPQISPLYASDTVAFGQRLVTAEENQHLGEVKTRVYHGKKGSVADYVEADRITGGDSVHIAGSGVINNIDSSNYVSTSQGSAVCKSINANEVSIGGMSKAQNVASSKLCVYNQGHVDNALVQKELFILDKAVLNNAVLTEDNAEVSLFGEGSVTGKIEFKGKGGKVYLRRNYIKGTVPSIRREQVINGKIYKVDEKGKTIDITEPMGFAKVAGMKELKETLYTDVIEPLTKPELYKQYGLKPINGCLLYGPPGCGKTYIANALAEEAGRYFVEVSLSQISSPLQNLTNINLRRKFKEAERHAPSIIFLDEIETIAPRRDSLYGDNHEISERVTELLTLMNNCKDKNIFIICASNEPQNIDSAIRRSGRLDKLIYVGVPDQETRAEIFKMNLASRLTENDINYKLISEKMQNYISSDISLITDEAARYALKERIPISTEHLLKAIAFTKLSLTQSEIDYYKNKLEWDYD